MGHCSGTDIGTGLSYSLPSHFGCYGKNLGGLRKDPYEPSMDLPFIASCMVANSNFAPCMDL